jgi:hypothetical protein
LEFFLQENRGVKNFNIISLYIKEKIYYMKAKKLIKKYAKLNNKEKIKFEQLYQIKKKFDSLDDINKRVEIGLALIEQFTGDNEELYINPDFILKKVMNFTDEEIEDDMAYINTKAIRLGKGSSN